MSIDGSVVKMTSLYSQERIEYNTFKRMFREAHPTVKRDNKYYATVRAAYKARGSTLDPWLHNGVASPRHHGPDA